ncbi:uncharacterized protein LOC132261267 [Phlebotomus argentipes]|uniref:uncharacterized protein LOC132261267 n=1 Tax=Phlebotomus argentipes TaxID=94469 RepID=UPI002893139C|nr:uncharacterized protein LOC132261267 [Phlebotomus argentipes]
MITYFRSSVKKKEYSKMSRLLKITSLFLVFVAIVGAFPTNQGPTKTGKIQHISEYYSSDHLSARPGVPSRPTPINPDIKSEPKPEEKIHLIPPKDEESHRQRRYVDETEAQDQPTTARPTRAWWRRMNYERSTRQPEQAAAEEAPAKLEESAEEDKSAQKEPTKEENCESEEQSKEIEKINKQSVSIQRIQTQSLPVIQPHREEEDEEK